MSAIMLTYLVIAILSAIAFRVWEGGYQEDKIIWSIAIGLLWPVVAVFLVVLHILGDRVRLKED